MTQEIIYLKEGTNKKTFYEYVYNDKNFMAELRKRIKDVIIEYGKIATEGIDSINNMKNISINVMLINGGLDINVMFFQRNTTTRYTSIIGSFSEPGHQSKPSVESLEDYVRAKTKFLNKHPELIVNGASVYPNNIATVTEYAQSMKNSIDVTGGKGGHYVFGGISNKSNKDGKGIIPVYSYKKERFDDAMRRVINEVVTDRFNHIDLAMFNQFNLDHAGNIKYLASFDNGSVGYRLYDKLSKKDKKQVSSQSEEEFNNIVNNQIPSIITYANSRAINIDRDLTSIDNVQFNGISGDYNSVLSSINSFAKGTTIDKINKIAKNIIKK